MIKKIRNLKFVIRNCQKGMTYVELIVVLSIFSVMSSIILFNYNKFQAKVDIRNLANDIALKIVQAQKEAISGVLPAQIPINSWKPSYGVYFNLTDEKSFIYFTDLDNLKSYDISSCIPPITSGSGECIDQINITKGNKISKLTIFYKTQTGSAPLNLTADMNLVFTRPNSGVIFSAENVDLDTSTVDYYQISISSSDNSTTSNIKVYPSGRIQVN